MDNQPDSTRRAESARRDAETIRERRIVLRNALQKYLDVPRDRADAMLGRLDPGQVERIARLTSELGPASAEAIRRVLAPPPPLPARPTGSPRPVRLRGVVDRPGGSGPSNGQYALQKALRRRVERDGIRWLRFGRRADARDLIWFWCWEHIPELLGWDALDRPWAAGPNILFQSSFAPCCAAGEPRVCRSPNCRLLFTESAWYRRLIAAHQRATNTAPIVVWPYPIDPRPEGPIFPAKYDLLIISKSHGEGVARGLADAFPNSLILRYGRFRRRQLFEAARASRCCVYLSNDDRGPLALAEILLAGCPAVGIERGAPWIETGRTGIRVEHLRPALLSAAVSELLDGGPERESIRRAAEERFDTETICTTILDALDAARRSG